MYPCSLSFLIFSKLSASISMYSIGVYPYFVISKVALYVSVRILSNLCFSLSFADIPSQFWFGSSFKESIILYCSRSSTTPNHMPYRTDYTFVPCIVMAISLVFGSLVIKNIASNGFFSTMILVPAITLLLILI